MRMPSIAHNVMDQDSVMEIERSTSQSSSLFPDNTTTTEDVS
jgi:hypothetical protein